MSGINVDQHKSSTTYNFSMIKLLLNFGKNNNIKINLHITDDKGRNIFHYCAMKLRFDLMIEIYHFAIKNNSPQLLRLLLNAQAADGNTPYIMFWLINRCNVYIYTQSTYSKYNMD